MWSVEDLTAADVPHTAGERERVLRELLLAEGAFADEAYEPEFEWDDESIPSTPAGIARRRSRIEELTGQPPKTPTQTPAALRYVEDARNDRPRRTTAGNLVPTGGYALFDSDGTTGQGGDGFRRMIEHVKSSKTAAASQIKRLKAMAKQRWSQLSVEEKEALKAAGITSAALLFVAFAAHQDNVPQQADYTHADLMGRPPANRIVHPNGEVLIRQPAGHYLPEGPTSGYKQGGSGLSPCEHMKEAGRAVFTLAEKGDKKAARKELAELTQHLKEVKKYIAQLK